MRWWKVSYDFHRPFWDAYGRNAFIRAPSHEAAMIRALAFIRLAEPGAKMTRIEVTETTLKIRMLFWRRVQASRLWKRNVAAGIPNNRRLL
jgi:hypothetical protein